MAWVPVSFQHPLAQKAESFPQGRVVQYSEAERIPSALWREITTPRGTVVSIPPLKPGECWEFHSGGRFWMWVEPPEEHMAAAQRPWTGYR